MDYKWAFNLTVICLVLAGCTYVITQEIKKPVRVLMHHCGGSIEHIRSLD